MPCLELSALEPMEPVRLDIPEGKLTPAQRREAKILFTTGYIVHRIHMRTMAKNRPLWRLVDIGIATFGSGPPNSWIKMDGFMPVWNDPVC